MRVGTAENGFQGQWIRGQGQVCVWYNGCGKHFNAMA